MRRIHTTKPGHASLPYLRFSAAVGSAGADRLMLRGRQSRAAGMRGAEGTKTQAGGGRSCSWRRRCCASPAIGGKLQRVAWRLEAGCASPSSARACYEQRVSVEAAGRATAEAAWRLEVEAELMVLRDELEVMRMKMAEMLG